MKGDFCRMCGSEQLKRIEWDLFLASQNKTIKAVSIWRCENCGEEFLDDSSQQKLYGEPVRLKQRQIVTACTVQ